MIHCLAIDKHKFLKKYELRNNYFVTIRKIISKESKNF